MFIILDARGNILHAQKRKQFENKKEEEEESQ